LANLKYVIEKPGHVSGFFVRLRFQVDLPLHFSSR
jgi:hypothetical protein